MQMAVPKKLMWFKLARYCFSGILLSFTMLIISSYVFFFSSASPSSRRLISTGLYQLHETNNTSDRKWHCATSCRCRRLAAAFAGKEEFRRAPFSSSSHHAYAPGPGVKKLYAQESTASELSKTQTTVQIFQLKKHTHRVQIFQLGLV